MCKTCPDAMNSHVPKRNAGRADAARPKTAKQQSRRQHPDSETLPLAAVHVGIFGFVMLARLQRYSRCAQAGKIKYCKRDVSLLEVRARRWEASAVCAGLAARLASLSPRRFQQVAHWEERKQFGMENNLYVFFLKRGAAPGGGRANQSVRECIRPMFVPYLVAIRTRRA